ncbi:MAG TPA: ABC transporter substrate-binding protein [Candidatus Limnocylindria bacterium]|nr:ABC transporter substrate-binding protein [Candidatus Limnocylindria bacterium]
MTTRRIFLGALVILFAATWAAAPALAQKRGGTLTVGNDEDAVGLDPHLSFAFASSNFYEHVYSGLTRFNAKMEIEGDLATSWEIPNPTTYVFRLRKGVKFHNGREMTAEDVKYSIERVRDPKNGSPIRGTYSNVETVEIVDPHTVRLRLNRPSASLLSGITGRASYVVPKEEVDRHGSLQKVMVGTGPFKLAEHVPGDFARFVRNEHYYEAGLPYLDGFTIKIIKDESSRLAALRRGTVDLTWIKATEIEELARREKGLSSADTPEARHLYIWLNTKEAPFDNVKLRQAFAAALDRKEIIDTVLLGRGKLTAGIPPATVPYVLSEAETAALPFYKQDYELVKRLLREAGHPNGFEFTFKTSPHSPDYVPAAQVIQRQLARAGITMKIEQVEWAALLKSFREKAPFQATAFARIWYADPEGYVYDTTHSKGAINAGHYVNAEVDRLLEEQRAAVDPAKRVALWQDLQRLYAQDVPIIWPYAMRTRYNVWRPTLKGFLPMANASRVYLRQTWLEQ